MFHWETRRVLSLFKDVLLRTRRGLYHYSKMFCWEPEGGLSLFKDVLLRTRRVLSLFKDVLLRTRKALSPQTSYSDSTLLILNRTSLNIVSALLTLKWQYMESKLSSSVTFRMKTNLCILPPLWRKSIMLWGYSRCWHFADASNINKGRWSCHNSSYFLRRFWSGKFCMYMCQ